MKNFVLMALLLSTTFACGVQPQNSASAVLANPGGGDALYPVNESPRDEAMMEAIDKIRSAIEKRDVSAMKSLLHPQVSNEMSGDFGPAEIIESLQLNDKQGFGWKVLEKAFNLGGTFSFNQVDGPTFHVPYVSSLWPSNIDPFSHALITGKFVSLRQKPGLSSRVLVSLTYDFVKIQFNDNIVEKDGYSWIEVTTDNGVKGWVASEYLRTALDYRFIFVKGLEGWQIKYLAAGD